MKEEIRRESEFSQEAAQRAVAYIINTCKENRIQKGLSVEDVAIKADVRASRVRKFEETGSVTVDEALAIAHVVCEDVSALFCESDKVREDFLCSPEKYFCEST